MRNLFKNISNLYLDVPKLTKSLFPIIILEHLVTAFCLNISVFFKKVSYFQYEKIGEFISIYYWGCLIGALIGGALTLHYRTTKISGGGLIFLGACLLGLINPINQWLIGLSLFFGLIFSMVKVVFVPTLIERFGSNMMSAVAASINPWVIFLIQPLIIGYIKNSNSTLFLGFGGLIVGLSYFMFGMVNSFLFTALILILLTFGEMMFGPLSKHFNVQLYKPGQEGMAAGVWRAVFLGSGAIGPVLSGYMAEYYGTHVVWECCGLLGLLCFIFSFYLRKIQIKMPYNKLVLDN